MNPHQNNNNNGPDDGSKGNQSQYWSWNGSNQQQPQDTKTGSSQHQHQQQQQVNQSSSAAQQIIPSIPTNSSQLLQLEGKKAAFKLTTLSPKGPEPSTRAELLPHEDMVVDEAPAAADTHGFLPFQSSLVAFPPPPGFESITKKLTQYLLQTYVTCNPNYSYQPINNPRRVLTKPSKHAGNDGYDNEDCDYILYVNDIMGSTEGHQYQIIDALGSGTFGQVVKCQNIKTKDFVALKVIKNKPAYYNQSLIEVAILDMIKKQYDVNGKHHLVRMRDSFVFRNHLCIAFEMLSVNLYELIKQNQFRGLSTNLIRVFVTQILDALTVLYKAKIIHCDLKPENILLKSLESPSIKVIDLGSACHENQTVYTYIQSRFYRSPEVLLGLSYTSSIDMWSLGCIAAELFLGLPLFPGSSEYNQMSRIIEILGNPPNHMCDKGKNGAQYFTKSFVNGKYLFAFKSMEQYMRDHGTKEQPSKRYFQGQSLPEIINSYPIMRRGLSNREIEIEMQNRRSFIDFLSGMLRLNPLERWTPQQALQHPFITQKPFLEPFMPVRPVKVATPITDTRNSTGPPPQQPLSNSYQQQPPLANTYPEKNAMDSRYTQVVGTFSEFQINQQQQQQPQIHIHPGSVPESSMMQAHAQQQHTQPPNSFSGIPFQSQSMGNTQVAYNMRKSTSQFGGADRGGGVVNHTMGHFNPAMYQQYNSEMAAAEQAGYIEGHPRYGDQGERIRIPSRLPSAAASVDWEIFEGGASVPNSYASSRQGSASFADLHQQQQQQYLQQQDGRRHSLSQQQSFASPNSARHMPFQGRNFSNDSFGNDNFSGRNSESMRVSESGMQRTSASNSTHSLNGSFLKTHKKVKSSSASSLGQHSNESGVYSRRPSVPSNFYPQVPPGGQPQLIAKQPSYENFQFSIQPNGPYPGSEPIQMPKVPPKKE